MIALKKAIEGYLLDIAASYATSTVRMYTFLLRQLANRIGADREISEITSEELKRYMLYMKVEYKPRRVRGSTRMRDPLSPSALDNIWKCLRSFFRWCANNEGIQNPTTYLPRPRFSLSPQIPYTLDEIKRLIEAAQYYYLVDKTKRHKRPMAHRNLAIIMILLDTGMRVGELCRLNIADVRLEVGEINIEAFGTGRKTKGRTAYLGASAKKAVWRYLSTISDPIPSDSLFNMPSEAVRQVLLNLGAAAQVPNCHPHRFRHTFAIEYLRNGGDVYTLQRILGHSTLEMVEHYLNLVSTDVQMAHKKASPADRWKL